MKKMTIEEKMIELVRRAARDNWLTTGAIAMRVGCTPQAAADRLKKLLAGGVVVSRSSDGVETKGSHKEWMAA